MRLALAASWIGVLLPGCIASNVVAPTERAVASPVDALQFAPAVAVELAGLWQSVDIRGDAAGSLRRIWYWFRDDGTYSAVALVDGGGGAFQVRDGAWRFDAAGLVLDGAEPLVSETVGPHLRLSSAAGSVVLRKETTL